MRHRRTCSGPRGPLEWVAVSYRCPMRVRRVDIGKSAGDECGVVPSHVQTNVIVSGSFHLTVDGSRNNISRR